MLFASLAANGVLAQTNEFRAFWVDAFGAGFKTSSEVTTLMNDLRAANANAVFPEIRKRGDAYYSGSPYEPKATDISPSSFDPLQDMINKAHDTSGGKQRIEVHAWIVSYKIWGNQTTPPGASTPPHPYNAHPDWLMEDASGGTWDGTSYAFDPGHPDVQRYTYNVCMDIITRYDVDGLNFDYIRYPGSAWGYHPVTVARFNARYGRTGQPSTSDSAWMQFRRDQVTALVRKVYLNAIALKPGIKISADTITGWPGPSSPGAYYSSSRAYTYVLQDWRGWMQEGILDLNIPMTYFDLSGNYATDWVLWNNFAKDFQYNRHAVIGPGIYLNSVSDGIEEMRFARTASPSGNSARGICGYSYRVTNKDGVSRATFLDALVNPSAYDPITPPIFEQQATIPVMPWKTAPSLGHLMGTVYSGTPTNELDGAVVTVTGPVTRAQTNDATGFYGFVDLPPGTYTVQASFPGYFDASTNVTISAGVVATRDLDLPISAAPEIVTQPASVVGYVGTPASFFVTAAGSPPLEYQWRKDGTNLPGSTNATHAIAAIGSGDVGGYSVVVSNGSGAITSSVATLTLLEPVPGERLATLWHLSPGDRPYLTISAPPTERGLACCPGNGHLLLVSRVGSPAVYVLDGNNGADLHSLSNGSGVVSGGTYAMNMVGVADDGAVYVCNLTTDGSSSPLKIYRWANDDAGTLPTVAYSGNPDGNGNRWGDTLDVRGAGTATQIVLGSRLGTTAVMLTTDDGATFTATPLTVSGGASGMFGLGIAFGAGDTFWGKATSQPLRQIAFDLENGLGSVIQSFADPVVPSSMMAIGVDPDSALLGGIVLDAPDNFQLYDLPAAGSPGVIETNAFPSDEANTYGTGAVDFGGDCVYALDSNNGILAMQILPPKTAPSITQHPVSQSVLVGSNVTFSVVAEGYPELSYQWLFDGATITGATGTNYTRPNVQTTDSGAYSVMITNLAGGVVSSNAVLTVNPWAEIRFESITALPDGRVQLEISGQAGQAMWIEQTAQLSNWFPLTNLIMSNSLIELTDDGASNQPVRLYRAHQ